MPRRSRVHNPLPNVVRRHQERARATKENERQRQRLNAYQRGYNREWNNASRAFLKANPLCVGPDSACDARGKRTASTDTDHIVPHRGNMRLFWDPDNWQPLCHTCHASKTAREDGGFGREVVPARDRRPLTPTRDHTIPPSRVRSTIKDPAVRQAIARAASGVVKPNRVLRGYVGDDQ